MTWRSPDTYHSAGNGRGTATFKFYEGRGILSYHASRHHQGMSRTDWETIGNDERRTVRCEPLRSRDRQE